MNELEQCFAQVLADPEDQKAINNAYLQLLKTELFVPVFENSEAKENEDPYIPLFYKEGEDIYIAVFEHYEQLKAWAGDKFSEFKVFNLIGKDMFMQISETTHLCLFYGENSHKIFVPAEIMHLKRMISKIEAIAR